MSHQSQVRPAPVGMSAALIFLFALAGGSAVSNLYWAQPLLSTIARSFGVNEGTAGSLITATQVGYGIGVFLVVPLGDVLNRRHLIPLLLFCCTLALLCCAMAPSFALLWVSLVFVGMTTVSGQLLVPLTGDLVQPSYRGRVVGIVVSGLLTGILLSRTISGFLGDLLGWRSVYWISAFFTVVIGVLLARAIPADPSRPRMPYGKLLASVIGVVRQYRTVRVTLFLGAVVFSVFTMFWTGMTFLLSSPPYSYSLSKIGLIGLVGLAGALAAQRSGIFHDKGWSVHVSGAGLLLAFVAVVIAAAGMSSIGWILLAVLLLDIAVQTVNVLNQTRLFAVDPSARSRLNTAFITGSFIGGAIGSALAGVLWELCGWLGIQAGAGFLLLLGLLAWAKYRKDLDTRRF